MVSIAREFSGECFDFDRLCATCLGGLVLKHEQKEVDLPQVDLLNFNFFMLDRKDRKAG